MAVKRGRRVNTVPAWYVLGQRLGAASTDQLGLHPVKRKLLLMLSVPGPASSKDAKQRHVLDLACTQPGGECQPKLSAHEPAGRQGSAAAQEIRMLSLGCTPRVHGH